MAGEHYIEVRDFVSGDRLGIITGATSTVGSNGLRRLLASREVNGPGRIELEVPATHPLMPLADKTLLLDWRRDTRRGIPWYLEQAYLARDAKYRSNRGERSRTIYGEGLLSILDWYHVLWPAGTTNRTAFSAVVAETVMKTIVTYNATASATSGNGRDRTAPLYGVAVESDGAGGNVVTWTAARSRTVLQELQALALIGGGDFDLEYTTPTTRTFRWYTGQRGQDKSALITFAENLGNIDNVEITQRRSQERTAAVVAGQGEGEDREFVTRLGPNYASGNDIEMFVDARDIALGATAALQDRGDQKLSEVQARVEYTFDVLQTQGTYYGPSGAGAYSLGDLVTARIDSTSDVLKIMAVTMEWRPGEKESIGIEVGTP